MSVMRWNAGAIDEAGMRALAVALADAARAGGVIHLEGDLGAGKTTFARALLAALGVGERIKSPTYSLIESYRVGELDAHHLDLYRIADPGELEWLGLADLWSEPALVLVEWPERAGRLLPNADLALDFEHAPAGRRVALGAGSAAGRAVLDALRLPPGCTPTR